MYDVPSKDKPCQQCKYYEYDTWHNERWCSHEPTPDGLAPRLIVDRWGTCEYWEKED